MYRLHHLDHPFQVLVGGIAPGCAHAETARPLGPGGLSSLHDLFQGQQLLRLQTGGMAGALGTVAAILRAGAGLDAEQAADLHLVGIEVGAVQALGAEDQVIEGLVQQGLDLFQSPIMA